MATGLQIAEHILDLLENYSSGMDDKYEERDILFAMDMYTAELAKEKRLLNIKMGYGESLPDSFVASFFDVQIYYDEDLELCYSIMPVQPMDISTNSGIDFVSSMRNRSNPYIVLRRTDASLLSRHPAGRLEGMVGCWTEGTNRLYYTKKFDGSENTTVFMRLITNEFSLTDRNAQYPITKEEQAELVRRVVAHFTKKGEQDKTKDSTDHN